MTPENAEVRAVLEAWAAGARGRPGEVSQLEDLTPGLSAALVVRVRFQDPPGSIILKRPSPDVGGLLARHDEASVRRETEFFRSAVRALVASRIRVPDVTIVEDGSVPWLVLEDLEDVLDVDWDSVALHGAVSRLAPLAGISLGASDQGWVESEGWRSYSNSACSAREHIEGLNRIDAWASAFDAREREELRRIVDDAPTWFDRFAALPQVFVHGDAHPGNAGFAGEQLALIDWEHAGTGVPGFDAATFVSGFHLFGGHGSIDDHEVLNSYLSALPAGIDPDHARAGFWLTLVTWALHIRLGPGATAILAGYLGPGSDEEAVAVADIIEGCRRALIAASELRA